MRDELAKVVESALIRIGEVVTAIVIIAGLFRWVLQDKYDSSVISAVARRRSDLREMIDTEYADRIETIDVTMEVTRANKDRLDAVMEISKLQGQRLTAVEKQLEMMPSMQGTLERLDKSINNMAEKFEGVAKEVAFIRGQWDGNERRHQR